MSELFIPSTGFDGGTPKVYPLCSVSSLLCDAMRYAPFCQRPKEESRVRVRGCNLPTGSVLSEPWALPLVNFCDLRSGLGTSVGANTIDPDRVCRTEPVGHLGSSACTAGCTYLSELTKTTPPGSPIFLIGECHPQWTCYSHKHAMDRLGLPANSSISPHPMPANSYPTPGSSTSGRKNKIVNAMKRSFSPRSPRVTKDDVGCPPCCITGVF